MANASAKVGGGLAAVAVVLVVLYLLTRTPDLPMQKLTDQTRADIAHRKLELSEQRPLDMRPWTDRELFEACKSAGPRARLVFALGYLEQGDNFRQVNGNAWGVEAAGPGPKYGWGTAAGVPDPIGWAVASEAGTGLQKPFCCFRSLAEGAAFVGDALRRKGFRGIQDYVRLWNPGLPPGWLPSCEKRWAVGEQVFDQLNQENIA